VARDASPFIRQAVVALLKRAAVTAGGLPIVPEHIYPAKAPPDAPYEKVQFGQPVTTPFLAGCLDGTATTFAVHSYAETTGEDETTIGGERRAHDLVGWAATVLGGEDEHAVQIDLQTLSDCPFPATLFLEWTGTQVFGDGLGTDAFHGIATFSATVSS
jgi:hypothetical protein